MPGTSNDSASAVARSDIRWTPLLAREHFLVFGVWPDPEPDDLAAVHRPGSAVTAADSGRIDQQVRMHSLEPQPWMRWIREEPRVRLTRVNLNRFGQIRKETTKARGGAGSQSFSGSSSRVRPARCSAIASPAIFSSYPGDRAKRSSQRRSDSSSASSQSAIASCSFSGRTSIADTAFSSFVVIRR
jgi:hypothetical protein